MDNSNDNKIEVVSYINNLPIEVTQQILLHLPRRSIAHCSTLCRLWQQIISQPIFYSTIKIYTKKQWEKFVSAARELIIHGKYMGYHVHQLIFYFDINTIDGFPNYFIDVLQNIQSINAPIKSNIFDNSLFYDTSFMTQLTFIPIWFTLPPNINIDKGRLKCIDLNVNTNDFLLDKTSQLIYLHSKEEYEQDNKLIMIVLGLSMFENLTILNFHFIDQFTPRFIYDERSIEIIHQSCVKLEKLSLDNFYMDISKEYDYPSIDYNSYKKIILPAKQMKELKISGILKHPKCYSYFSNKYPMLTSLHICIDNNPSAPDNSSTFSSEIYNMITNFQILKQLSIRLTKFKRNEQHFFPQNEIILWLHNHPKQITHLSYSHSLVPSFSSFLPSKSSSIVKQQLHYFRNEKNRVEQTKVRFYHNLNGSYLNHLSSLSLPFYSFVETVRGYFYHHPGTLTVTVSESIQEIRIYSTKKKNILYIYDWLTIFPSLKTLSAQNIGIIKDNEGMDDVDDQTIKALYQDYHEDKDNIILHELINKRIYQGQQNHIRNTNGGKNNDDKKIYPLKKLELENSIFHFKHGFNTFIKRFNQLNDLILNNIDLSFYDQQHAEQYRFQSRQLERVIQKKMQQILKANSDKIKVQLQLLQQRQKPLQQELLQLQNQMQPQKLTSELLHIQSLHESNQPWKVHSNYPKLQTLQSDLKKILVEIKLTQQQKSIVDELIRWQQKQSASFYSNFLHSGSFPPFMEKPSLCPNDPDSYDRLLFDESSLSYGSALYFKPDYTYTYLFNDLNEDESLSNTSMNGYRIFPPLSSSSSSSSSILPPSKRHRTFRSEFDDEILIMFDLSSTLPPLSSSSSSSSLPSFLSTFNSSYENKRQCEFKFKSATLTISEIEPIFQWMFDSIINEMNRDYIMDEINLDASHLVLDQLTINCLSYLPWHLNILNHRYFKKKVIIYKMNIKEKKNNSNNSGGFSIIANNAQFTSYYNSNNRYELQFAHLVQPQQYDHNEQQHNEERCILNLQLKYINEIIFTVNS